MYHKNQLKSFESDIQQAYNETLNSGIDFNKVDRGNDVLIEYRRLLNDMRIYFNLLFDDLES